MSMTRRAMVRMIEIAVFISLGVSALFAQIVSSVGDQPGIPATETGSPSGALRLDGFDTVNLFNGSVNFALPLLAITGRGAAQYEMTLQVENHWQVDKVVDPACGSQCTPLYLARVGWKDTFPVGYGPGTLTRRNLETRDLQPCGGSEGAITTSLTIFTFVEPNGTAHDLFSRTNSAVSSRRHCAKRRPIRIGARNLFRRTEQP